MNFSLQEKSIIRIEKVVYRGLGLGRIDGLTVFVPGTLKDELVEIEIKQHKKNFARGYPIKILEPSSSRIVPNCPLALKPGIGSAKKHCPGCSYQHVDYIEEVHLKDAQLCEMILHKKIAVDDEIFLPPVSSPSSIGYRNKITLHVARERGRVTLGYFGEDNVTVLDVEECPLAERPANALLKDLRSKSGFMASVKNGEALVLRNTPADGAHYKITSAFATKGMLTEETNVGTLNVPFSSFFQVNRPVADKLLKSVSDILKSLKVKNLVDLFCGIGVFGFAAARGGDVRVIGIDNDADSIAAASENAASLGLGNIEFIAQSAERGLNAIRNKIEGDRIDIIIDPPRSGLDRSVIEKIISLKPANILYVSCAADTLARDLQAFTAGQYGIASIQLFDMFPRTPYFETLVHLSS